MPSGKTHDRVTWMAAPLVALLGWQIFREAGPTAALTGAFVFAGLMFSGDLDTRSVQYRRWGWLRWIWIPYQKLVRHRSPFSHGILLGTITRLAYLSAWLALGFWLVSRGLESQQVYAATHQFLGRLQTSPLYLWSLMGGLWLGAFSHTVADHLVSGLKRLRRKGRRKAARLT